MEPNTKYIDILSNQPSLYITPTSDSTKRENLYDVPKEGERLLPKEESVTVRKEDEDDDEDGSDNDYENELPPRRPPRPITETDEDDEILPVVPIRMPIPRVKKTADNESTDQTQDNDGREDVSKLPFSKVIRSTNHGSGNDAGGAANSTRQGVVRPRIRDPPPKPHDVTTNVHMYEPVDESEDDLPNQNLVPPRPQKVSSSDTSEDAFIIKSTSGFDLLIQCRRNSEHFKDSKLPRTDKGNGRRDDRKKKDKKQDKKQDKKASEIKNFRNDKLSQDGCYQDSCHKFDRKLSDPTDYRKAEKSLEVQLRKNKTEKAHKNTTMYFANPEYQTTKNVDICMKEGIDIATQNSAPNSPQVRRPVKYKHIKSEVCTHEHIVQINHDADLRSHDRGRNNQSRIEMNTRYDDGTVFAIRNTAFDDRQNACETHRRFIQDLTISEVGEMLKQLKLGEYVEQFKDQHVSGEILSELKTEDLVSEFAMRKLEAIRLVKYLDTGHIPH